jgi:hypothetical protein
MQNHITKRKWKGLSLESPTYERRFEMRKFLILCALLAFAVNLFTWGPCLAIESQEVARIADNEKDSFLAALMVEYLKQYGPPKDSLNLTVGSLAELGPALQKAGLNKMPPSLVLEAFFQVHTIDADMVMAAAGPDDLKASIVPTDEWLIPVRIHNESVALLTVGKIDGKWQVVGNSLGDFGKRIEQVPPDFCPQKREESM